MNLVELYQETPAARHGDIRVADGRVFVRELDGSVAEYLVQGDELWLLHSDQKERQDIQAIKAKLGIEGAVQ